MTKKILAVDVGTTNILAMLVDESGGVVGKASGKFQLDYPAPGHVEQDPEAMWSTTLETIQKTLAQTGIEAKDVAAVGITGQRTTIIVWEKQSGRTLGPAIIWQDLRGTERARELNELGYITVNPLTAASKIESVLKAIPDGYQRMKNGELAWGNVDSFVAWRLSGGTVHATDASFACGTGYFDFLTEWKWFDQLLDTQSLEASFFPQVVDTAGIAGHTSEAVFGAKVPIGAIIGDQQSAAYAQGCLEPGEAKITFGTSGTCNVNTGQEIKLATGCYPLVLWDRDGVRTFCLEGMVITAGAVFNWLADLDILTSPAEAQSVAEQVESSNGVRFLPALQGLGPPHDQHDRYGAVEGLTLAVSKGHVVRAAMEGIAFRVREMLERIYEDSGLANPAVLRVDGGASTNDLFMQILADILGVRIERMDPTEATAFGAALLAGETCGIWEPNSPEKLRKVDGVFEPKWEANRRDEEFLSWRETFGLLPE
ncbi:MAG: hypothetical protein GY866_12860 [Proteobacteria bacterium]|nr:hypothetical protein [Pseudomonadota bacterium]